jgi:excisionase family DNA binding protein
MKPGERLLTPRQLAAERGVDRTTLYRLIAEGDLACVRIGTGTRARIRVLESDWEEWVMRHRVPAIAPSAPAPPKPEPTLSVLGLPGATRYLS